VIRVLDGDGGRVHVFDKAEVTLGSAEHCDLRLADGADEVHCIVALTRQGYLIEDLRSSSGTLVDGTPVRQAFVEPGARVGVGRTVLELLEPR